jgi:hypothetical protein
LQQRAGQHLRVAAGRDLHVGEAELTRRLLRLDSVPSPAERGLSFKAAFTILEILKLVAESPSAIAPPVLTIPAG